MKRHIYEETTQWTDSAGANHVYIFNDKPSGRTATALGYVPVGSTKVQKFRTPLKLDLKGRTFKELA
jgi:hypothetical protein